MSEELKNKVILIGKEPQHKNLMIAVLGFNKCGLIGNPGCVPNTVSRCIPASNVSHAKISVDSNGNMILYNVKDLNVTFVNGMQIMSKKIVLNDKVELGADKYQINIEEVIQTANKIVGAKAPVKKFDISHLERIWNDYNEEKHQIQAEVRKKGQVRGTLAVIAACGIPGAFFIHPALAGLTVFGAIGAIYSLVSTKKDDTSEKLEKLNDVFQDKYICPNPECNCFLGYNNYKFVKRQFKMHCPFCKCEYTEK